MKLINKKDILIFSIIFLIGLAIVYPLIIQMHFAPDTYQIVTLGYSEYAKQFFLKSGRIITAASFFMADWLDIPYKVYVIFMELVSIFSLALSTVLLYKLFLNKIQINNKLKEYLLLAASFLIIFNMFALEFLLYAESGIICLSVLFSILGLRAFYSNSKYRYLKAMILVIIATILYQGNVNIFFTLATMFSFLVDKQGEKQNWKKTIKDIFLAGTILVIAFIVTASLIFICSNIINLDQERFASSYDNISLRYIIESFIYTARYISIYAFNFMKKGLLIYIIIFTSLYLSLKKSFIYLIEYLFIILIAFGVCILPIYTMADVFINARMCMSIGAITGISFVYIVLNINYKGNIEKYFVTVLILLMLIYTCYNYLVISQSNIEENQVDNEVGYKIKDLVQKYEEENNIKITKISVTHDTNRSFYTSNKIKNTFTERSTANYYCIKEVMEYYLNRNLEAVDMNEDIYSNNFYNKNWNQFSEEQIIFDNETMYMCIY